MDAIRRATAVRSLWIRYFLVVERADFGHFYGGRSLATSLHDAQIVLVGIGLDFICEGKAALDSTEAFMIRYRNKSSRDIGGHCLYPIFDAG